VRGCGKLKGEHTNCRESRTAGKSDLGHRRGGVEKKTGRVNQLRWHGWCHQGKGFAPIPHTAPIPRYCPLRPQHEHALLIEHDDLSRQHFLNSFLSPIASSGCQACQGQPRPRHSRVHPPANDQRPTHGQDSTSPLPITLADGY
jgi:hypothetical protein